jgi:RNA polymerase sigma-70 factor (ECF subfamily)
VTAPTFESLLDRHQREIMAYIVRSLGDHELAQDVFQDVFQDTFLRAFRAYGRLPSEANHRAWLYRIASNACHDAHRQRARSPLPLDESVAANDFPDSSDRELAGAVVAFVRSLPERQRQSLVLRKFQGMDYGEIAAVLGCSPEAARANVYQGLRKVRAHFAEVDHD